MTDAVQRSGGVAGFRGSPAAETGCYAGGAVNATLLIATAQAHARDRRVAQRTGEAHAALSQGEMALARQQDALETAREAREESGGLLGFASDLGLVGEILAGVALVGATVATGGVGAAVVAGAGIALTMSSDDIAEELDGVVGHDVACALGTGLSLVGATLSGGVAGGAIAAGSQLGQLGASKLAGQVHSPELAAGLGVGIAISGGVLGASLGGGAGAAADVPEDVQRVGRAVRDAGTVLSGAVEVEAGLVEMAAAGATREADGFDVEAERQANRLEACEEQMSDATDDVRDAMRVFARVARRVQAMARTQAETMTAIIGARV